MNTTAQMGSAGELTAITEEMGRPPRLLIAATSYITLRAFLLPFADHFRSLGWRVDAMADGVEGAEGTRARFDNVFNIQLSRNPLALSNLTSAPDRILRIVGEGDYDLVHVHTPIASLVTRGALRNMRKRGRPVVIYTAHGFHFYRGSPLLKSLIYKTFERIGGLWTDYLVTINKEDYQTAKDMRLVNPQRVYYMPGIGVDTQALQPDRVSPQAVEGIRKELGLANEQSFFLMVANFDPGKRHRELLSAFQQLNRPDVHLVFAGIGPLLEAMQQLAKTLGIADRCHFLGFRKDVPALMRASIATVLPSEREGLPRSVMESMCLGTPVVGTNIRGLGDLIQDGCGYMFQVGDVQGLRNQLQRVLEDAEGRALVAQHARARILEFDIKNVITAHENLYAIALQNAVRKVV